MFDTRSRITWHRSMRLAVWRAWEIADCDDPDDADSISIYEAVMKMEAGGRRGSTDAAVIASAGSV